MKRFLVIPFLVFALNVSAGPIGVERAKELASQFFNQNATRATAATVELEWAGSSVEGAATRTIDADEALVYVFNRTDDKGFVVLSGEDSYRHVMAFSYDNSFDMGTLPESARYIMSDWCKTIAQKRENAPEMPTSRAEALEYDLGVGKVVVDHNTAKWGQGDPYNRECPIWYDSPYRTITGCVATSMAIVMYHHKWPKSGEGVIGGYNSYNDANKHNPARELGREYKWDKMIPRYRGVKFTSEQGDAVASLMFDCGTALHMSYGVPGSGSHTAKMPGLYINHFKYSPNAVYLGAGKLVDTDKFDAEGNKISEWVPGDFSYDEWVEAVERNLKDFGPMNVSLAGHSVAYDGYTDKHYIKINHGWDGSADGFFYLPDHWHVDGGWYYPNTAAVFYIKPLNEDGSFDPLFQISGGTAYGFEVVDAHGFTPGQSFDMNWGTVKNIGGAFDGEIAIVMCDKDGNVVEVLDSKTTKIGTNSTYAPAKSVTINKPVKPGYRLRLYYKSKGSNTWKWARHDKLRNTDEIVVCASPEEIAQMTSFKYTKQTKRVMFTTPLSVEYEVRNDKDEIVEDGTKKKAGGLSSRGFELNLTNYEPGDYTVSITCGSDPYVFILTR